MQYGLTCVWMAPVCALDGQFLIFSTLGFKHTLKYLLFFWSRSQKYLISVAGNRCCLIVLFTIPAVVVLSTCTGVGGWGCPSSNSVRQMIIASWALRNSALSSASAADAAINLRIAHMMRILPLSWISLSSFGVLPRNKYPPALLLPWPDDKNDTSKCKFSIISDT